MIFFCVWWQHWTRWGVFQYVLVRLVCTVLTFALSIADLYGEGEFSRLDRGYVYTVVAINLSQAWALYCLALFYLRYKHALANLRVR